MCERCGGGRLTYFVGCRDESVGTFTCEEKCGDAWAIDRAARGSPDEPGLASRHRSKAEVRYDRHSSGGTADWLRHQFIGEVEGYGYR